MRADALLGEARSLSRHAIEQLIARWFPRPDVETRVDPVASQSALPLARRGDPASGRRGAANGPGTPGTETALPRARLEPLSASRYRVQFTASEELYAKIEQARELLSHALPVWRSTGLFRAGTRGAHRKGGPTLPRRGEKAQASCAE